MSQERIYVFDHLKFLLIFLVVVGHLIEPLLAEQNIQTIYMCIYTVHIPLLLFISGYFSKNFATPQYAKKILKTLVIPYMIFESLYSMFDFWLFDRDQLEFTFFTPYWLMWFLFSLFLYKIILPYVVHFKYALIVSIVVALLIGYANDVTYYASLSRAFVFFPFYLLGYYCEYRYIERLNKPIIRMTSIIILIGIYICYTWFGDKITEKWLYESYPYEALGFDQWYSAIYRLGIMLLAFVLGVCLLSLAPRRRLPVITSLSRNTLSVYLLHGFIIMYMNSIHFAEYVSLHYGQVYLFIIAFGITLLLSTSFVQYGFRYAMSPLSSLKSSIAVNEMIYDRDRK